MTRINNAVYKMAHGEQPPKHGGVRRVVRYGARQPVRLGYLENSTGHTPTHLSKPDVVTLWHLASGFSDRQIAAAMGLELSTVKKRVADLLQLLALDNRTQMALYALRVGIIRLDQIHIGNTALQGNKVAL